jgi:flavin-dependent dehydrogenase
MTVAQFLVVYLVVVFGVGPAGAAAGYWLARREAPGHPLLVRAAYVWAAGVWAAVAALTLAGLGPRAVPAVWRAAP